MKKASFLFATLLWASSSFASVIDGEWALPEMSSGGIKFNASIVISDALVTMKTKCSMGGSSAQVEVSVPAQITDTQIISLGKAEKTVVQNGITCSASAEPGAIDYGRINPNTMMLRSGAQSFMVQRVP